MYTPQNHPPTRNAFTIIELLVVLAIIAILAGITFGLMTRTGEQGRTSRAQTELRALAQALEQYQGHYGDYPWVNVSGIPENERVLFNALAGTIGPRGAEITDDGGSRRWGRVFVDFSRLNVADSGELPERDESARTLNNRFLDPWDNPYRYYYKHEGSEGNWERTGFVLYSMGPSGEHEEPPDSGIMPDHEDNDDNIYFDD